jgi:hypothetical protein
MPTVTWPSELDPVNRKEARATVDQLTDRGWVDVPFGAERYRGVGNMTWSLIAANQYTFAYKRLDPTTVILHVELVNTTVGGTLGTYLQITLPAGMVGACDQNAGWWGQDNGNGIAVRATVQRGSTQILLLRADLANWAASTKNTTLGGQMVLRLLPPVQ